MKCPECGKEILHPDPCCSCNVSEGYSVDQDVRFTRATYVVEDDHVIEYAGQSFKAAQAVVRGSGKVVVWMDGEWMGDVNFKGQWRWIAFGHPANKAIGAVRCPGSG